MNEWLNEKDVHNKSTIEVKTNVVSGRRPYKFYSHNDNKEKFGFKTFNSR